MVLIALVAPFSGRILNLVIPALSNCSEGISVATPTFPIPVIRILSTPVVLLPVLVLNMIGAATCVKCVPNDSEVELSEAVIEDSPLHCCIHKLAFPLWNPIAASLEVFVALWCILPSESQYVLLSVPSKFSILPLRVKVRFPVPVRDPLAL
ncbi:hypothetical protein D3C87_1612750 [compost metagenome]